MYRRDPELVAAPAARIVGRSLSAPDESDDPDGNRADV
jgi:hypothetical protein